MTPENIVGREIWITETKTCFYSVFSFQTNFLYVLLRDDNAILDVGCFLLLLRTFSFYWYAYRPTARSSSEIETNVPIRALHRCNKLEAVISILESIICISVSPNNNSKLFINNNKWRTVFWKKLTIRFYRTDFQTIAVSFGNLIIAIYRMLLLPFHNIFIWWLVVAGAGTLDLGSLRLGSRFGNYIAWTWKGLLHNFFGCESSPISRIMYVSPSVC